MSLLTSTRGSSEVQVQVQNSKVRGRKIHAGLRRMCISSILSLLPKDHHHSTALLYLLDRDVWVTVKYVRYDTLTYQNNDAPLVGRAGNCTDIILLAVCEIFAYTHIIYSTTSGGIAT